MNEWKQHVTTYTINAHRAGWIGAWDALVAAVTGEPRFSTAQPVTLSFWAKGDPNYSVANIQLEQNK